MSEINFGIILVVDVLSGSSLKISELVEQRAPICVQSAAVVEGVEDG